MARLLLTSNGFFTDSIKEQFLSLIEGKLGNIKATIITTAAVKQKENNKYAIKAKMDFLKLGFRNVVFTDVEFDHSEMLEQFNLVYINGGNPFYLLHHLKKSGADAVLTRMAINNTLIVGVSAGAMILGPNLGVANAFTPELNAVNLRNENALGLTDRMIFPHYDREDLFPDPEGKSIETRLAAYERKNHCNVVRIKDDQSVLIND